MNKRLTVSLFNLRLSLLAVAWEKRATIKLANKFPYALITQTGACYFSLPFTASPLGENRGDKTGSASIKVNRCVRVTVVTVE